MKSYPSIKRYREDRHANFNFHTFAKIDGSNLRFEWDKKKGWYRFGSRRRLLEESHEVFGCAMDMFRNELAESFESLAVEKSWTSIIVFCEFWGPNSFAGEHETDDVKTLTPIDIGVYKKGLLPVDEFIDRFSDKLDLGYLGRQTWDADFVKSVQASTHAGMAFEGVIGKNGTGHKSLSIKLKSQAWIDKVMQKYGKTEGLKIVNS